MVPSVILREGAFELCPKQWLNPLMDLELNGLMGEPRTMERKALEDAVLSGYTFKPQMVDLVSFFATQVPWGDQLCSAMAFYLGTIAAPCPRFQVTTNWYYWNHKRKQVHLPWHFFSSGFCYSGERLVNTTLITMLKIKHNNFVYSITERIEGNCCRPQTTKGENQDSNPASKSLCYTASLNTYFFSLSSPLARKSIHPNDIHASSKLRSFISKSCFNFSCETFANFTFVSKVNLFSLLFPSSKTFTVTWKVTVSHRKAA